MAARALRYWEQLTVCHSHTSRVSSEADDGAGGGGRPDSVWGRAGGLPRREDTSVLSLRMRRSLAMLNRWPTKWQTSSPPAATTVLLYINTIFEWEGR